MIKTFIQNLDGTTVATLTAITTAWLLYIFDHIGIPWYLVLTALPLLLQSQVLIFRMQKLNTTMLKHNIEILDHVISLEIDKLKLQEEIEKLERGSDGRKENS